MYIIIFNILLRYSIWSNCKKIKNIIYNLNLVYHRENQKTKMLDLPNYYNKFPKKFFKTLFFNSDTYLNLKKNI